MFSNHRDLDVSALVIINLENMHKLKRPDIKPKAAIGRGPKLKKVEVISNSVRCANQERSRPTAPCPSFGAIGWTRRPVATAGRNVPRWPHAEDATTRAGRLGRDEAKGAGRYIDSEADGGSDDHAGAVGRTGGPEPKFGCAMRRQDRDQAPPFRLLFALVTGVIMQLRTAARARQAGDAVSPGCPRLHQARGEQVRGWSVEGHWEKELRGWE